MDISKNDDTPEILEKVAPGTAWVKPAIASFDAIEVTEFNGGFPGDGNSNVT